MDLKLFDFELPKKLIAQSLAEPRDSSKLLCVNRNKKKIKNDYFYNIIKYLNKGDVLVINNTKVIPAKLYGIKKNNSVVKCLLIKEISKNVWEVLFKNSKKIKIGDNIVFGNSNQLKGKCIEIKEEGIRIIKFFCKNKFSELLDLLGEVPLPPYIKNNKHKTKNSYQTIYHKEGASIASPTAGLHFTKKLLKLISKKGIIITSILLNVGLGTFKPIRTKNIKDHIMHEEYYEISKKTALIINKAKKESRRIISVGTTTVRVLETVFNLYGKIKKTKGWTNIFIFPGYKFNCIDALITNFHLPKSTLLMLVSSFIGIEFMHNIYEYSIRNNYKFFSFGDAMFIE